jgi:hypothetical protein
MKMINALEMQRNAYKEYLLNRTNKEVLEFMLVNAGILFEDADLEIMVPSDDEAVIFHFGQDGCLIGIRVGGAG